MFSLSNNTMNKMAENNPLLAMMQSALDANSETASEAVEAWQKALPNAPLPSQAVAAAAATTAVGMGLYSQWLGTIYGAMNGAAKSASSAKPMMFNPLKFEWADVGETPKKPAAAKKAKAPKLSEPSNVVEKAKEETKAKVVTPEPVAEVPAAVPEKVELVADTPAVAAKPEAVAMATDVTPTTAEMKKPGQMPKPETPDDLKLISGVGPKLEKVLNGLGVWTFAQIADWTPAHVAWVDDFLQFSGRIDRDEWIKQAKELAGQ